MTSGSNVLRKLGLFYFYTVSYSHCNSRHKHADWCGCAHSKITHSYSNVHTLKHTRTHTQSFNVQWQYSLPSVRKYLSFWKCPWINMSRRKVVVQRTLTFDLPTKAVLFAYRLSSPHHHTHIHSLLPPPSLMLYICACVYTICGCLEQRGQRGRRLTMKRMKSSTAMMVTMET